MDLIRKYIEAEEIYYDIDGDVILELSNLDYEYSEEIILQIDYFEPCLEKQNHFSQWVGGVVKNDAPYFFEVEYLKEDEGTTTFLSLNEISCDRYLDYINSNNILIRCESKEETEARIESLNLSLELSPRLK